jgi:hypothetical protein
MKDEIKKSFIQSNKDRDALSEEVIKELRAKGGDNMNGEVMADEKLMAGISFKDLKKMPGTTITEKLQKAGIKVIPKALTLQKAIELLKEKSK